MEDDLRDLWELLLDASDWLRVCDVGELALTNFDKNPGAIAGSYLLFSSYQPLPERSYVLKGKCCAACAWRPTTYLMRSYGFGTNGRR